MSMLMQDLIVTLLALAAALIILRRVFGVFRPVTAKPHCSNCASGAAACAAPAVQKPENGAVPLVLHRRS
jgi:hypothetical protein